MRLWTLTTALAALLFAAPAWSQSNSDWKTAVSGGGSCGGSISAGRRCFFPFTGGTSSTVKLISAEYATICFDPNTATDGTATAEVQVQWVNDSVANGATGSDNNSFAMLGTTLDGGDTSSCIFEVPTGAIWIKVSSASGGEQAVVTVIGAAK